DVLQAPSGFEAVAVVGREDLDMVLMDIQMPGMSGTEATARIRKLPGQGTLPVVALTAHAMSDERQALIASGFNDYQTKPVSMEQLARIIERWTGFKAQQNQQKMSDSSSDVINEIFSSKLALHHANQNTGLAIDMFSMLMTSLASEKDHLIELWEEESLDELLEVVHKLHGAARYCGVPLIRRALGQFETCLKANNVDDFPMAMRELISAIHELQEWEKENDWQRQLHDESTANA
ncbi:MAG: response regulator, partial [Thalassolituus sp.]